MPAGFGKRCGDCYWRDRSQRTALQLVELMSTARVREAFAAYTSWLLEDDKGLERRVRRLRDHAQFFVALDRLDDEPWTPEFLLEHFSTAALRRFELPVRWLEKQIGIGLSAEGKRQAADLRRVREAVAQVPTGTIAHEVINAFAARLIERHAAGDLSAHSARLAMRPAIALLAQEDRDGGRLPGQGALEAYLGRVPGQRAAVSTFLGFLKAKHNLTLQLPPKQTSTAARKGLEKQIAAMVLGQESSAGEVDRRWVLLALRYFHHLSSAQAKALYEAAPRIDARGGIELQLNGSSFWVPKQPGLVSAVRFEA